MSQTSDDSLPDFIAPMLAQTGPAFDSDQHLFEIKWDGTRTLAFIEADGYRLVNRRRIDMTDRYPEFAFLVNLPAGTVLDGEMVVLRDGKPDFNLLLSREQARSALKIRTASKSHPATFIVFDQVYDQYRSLMAEPLSERRQRLEALVKEHGNPRMILSQGVVGSGRTYFAEACRNNLEGVVAKRLDSRYLPGRRTDAWRKIKRGEVLPCAIIGFIPAPRNDLRSLILAAEDGGQLRCVGKVGTGYDRAKREELVALLHARLRPKPIIPCKIHGKWVEPGLYCNVRFMERTKNGELRAPVFEELVVREAR